MKPMLVVWYLPVLPNNYKLCIYLYDFIQLNENILNYKINHPKITSVSENFM